MRDLRPVLLSCLAFAPFLAAAVEPPVRTLLVELRNVPPALRASSGVEAGTGPYSFGSYTQDRILSAIRGTVMMLATPGELAKARADGLDATVVMEGTDLLALLRRAHYGPMLSAETVCHSYDRIVARAAELAAAHPALIHREQIGATTGRGRPIYAYRVSNRAAEPQERPAILFDGCHHSDEVMGAEIVLSLLERLAAGYGRDPQVTAWLDTLEIWLVPVVNVDGHDMVSSGRDPRWRKNLRDVNGDGVTGTYPEGVDVNRGYDFNWAMGGSGDPEKYSYRGPFPFSEAENRAMRHLAERRQFVLSVSYHSQGEVIYYPWTWNGQPAPDDAVIKRIAADVAAHIPVLEGPGTYAISPGGPSSQSYPWFYGRHGTIDLIIETGKGAHLFPPDVTAEIVAANQQGITALLAHARGPGLAVQVADAATGRPLVAEVWLPAIENETVDRRKTDERFGRRWRLLDPGKYDVIISAPGYRTFVGRALEVGAEGWTPLAVRLEPEPAP